MPDCPDAHAALAAEVKALQAQAVEHYRCGRLKAAEQALRAADNLARLQRRVGALGPSPQTPAEAARARIMAMSEDELRAELRKLVEKVQGAARGRPA